MVFDMRLLLKICIYAVLFSLAYFIRFVNLMWEEVLRNLSCQHAVLCIIFLYALVLLLFRQVKLDCSIQLSLVVSIAYIPCVCHFNCLLRMFCGWGRVLCVYYAHAALL